MITIHTFNLRCLDQKLTVQSLANFYRQVCHSIYFTSFSVDTKMALLTKDETLHMVRDVLEVPITELPLVSDASLSASSKIAFISSILKAHLERQPFQSITLMAQDVKDRHRPSWEEIKSNMLLHRGGLCYWHNTFMYALLSSLGFDVTMSHSTVAGFDRDNHLVVLVHDLVSKGDIHLVDVGMGFYIPRPIPLDFYDESSVFNDSILTYKIKKESPDKIIVLQAVKKDNQSSESSAEGHPSKEKQVETVSNANNVNPKGNSTAPGKPRSNKTNNNTKELDWNLFYYFDPTERFRNLEEFFPCFDICFTDVTKLPFHTSPRAIRFSNAKLVGIVNSKLLQENDEGELTKTVILKDISADNSNSSNETAHQGLEPLIDAYAKYFPQFPLEELLPALKNWREYQSQAEGPSHVDY